MIFDSIGTTTAMFYDFLDSMFERINRMEQAGLWPGPKCCIWDNLSSHAADPINNLLHIRQQMAVPRAPYWPVDSPIEYVFNQLEQELKRCLYHINTMDDLILHIREAIMNISTQAVQNTFIHCGYTV